MFLCTPLSKKISMKHIGALGLCFIAIGGIIPVLFHRYLWQVYLSSILLGLGTGLVNVISSTLISYYFTGTDKMKVMGYQICLCQCWRYFIFLFKWYTCNHSLDNLISLLFNRIVCNCHIIILFTK